MSVVPKTDEILIREVWGDNLEFEFALIREIVDDYPYIAMDTEFPGIVIRPLAEFKPLSESTYQTLRVNVDILKLIQLGLTFADKNGTLPTCGTGKNCLWQFNFREFNLLEDAYAMDSIELLRNSGIDFWKNYEKGIDAKRFGELLMSSGIVLNDDIHWLTFHSGYDFGYLLKVLTCRNLPETRVGFFELMRIFFPVVYDIKHLVRYNYMFRGGLSRLAGVLNVERVGNSHLAGSDSLLTSRVFFSLTNTFYGGSFENYEPGVLFGLGPAN